MNRAFATIYRALRKSDGCFMGTDLPGRRRAAPGTGAEKAEQRKRGPGCPETADRAPAYGEAPLPGGLFSIGYRSRGLRCYPPRREICGGPITLRVENRS
jgi:hypothetical protein